LILSISILRLNKSVLTDRWNKVVVPKKREWLYELKKLILLRVISMILVGTVAYFIKQCVLNEIEEILLVEGIFLLLVELRGSRGAYKISQFLEII